MECMALDDWTDIKQFEKFESIYVCLSMCVSEIPIVHDRDGSFCPIFLEFEA